MLYQHHLDAMKTSDFDQLVDDVFSRHQGLPVEGARPGVERQEMVVAADVALPHELVVEHEAAHREEVGSVKHLLKTSGQASVALEEPELSQRLLLFLLALLRERLLQSRAAAIGPVIGGQVQLGKQAVMKRLGQIVLELLDERFLTNERHELEAALSEETLGGLRRRFEVPLEMGQPVALGLGGAGRRLSHSERTR